MKKAVPARLLLLALTCLPSLVLCAQEAPARAAAGIMTVDQVRAGMRGVAYTVFEGTKPEPMEVEVLGVLKNLNGPRGDLIVIRLHGAKAEYTGVVSGMSGSPVYIEGKLVGALSYRLAVFAKEAIAGVTPIADMLEINELDRSPGPPASSASRAGQEATMAAVAPQPELRGYAQQLTPIETPLVFSGFSDDAVQRFAPQFAAAGIAPVMGAGAASSEPQPEPLEPGSAVSAVLVQGDMNIAATCSVTYVDPERLLACGHPLFQFGAVDLPMTKATVLATLPSSYASFKIINTTEAAGAFVQDRHTGILGRFGRSARMIPVTLNVHGGARDKQFHFQVLNHAKMTPLAMMITVFNALQGVNDFGEEASYRLRGKIGVEGYPDVSLENMYAPADSTLPTAYLVAIGLGDRFGRIFDNPYNTPAIQGVDLDFDLVRERRSARLENARTDATEAHPGDRITVEAVLRPYRGERIVRQVPVVIPASAPRGTLRILVSDGETLDRTRRFFGMNLRRLDLGATIASLNKEHSNSRLYVSLLQPGPQALLDDKVMPALPLSVLNVLDSLRNSQEMLLTAESTIAETSIPLDSVVSGAQVITITIK
jgi:hypothetical protein